MSEGYEIAVQEAWKGLEEGGLPIGSSLERDGQVIASGHNLRVQNGDPTAHAEISCLRNGDRQSTYRDTVLYTTLAPCFLCTGAILLFGIPRVVAGESLNFDGEGSLDLLRDRGIEVEILDDAEMQELMGTFIERNPALWREDIGH
jgi:creatinine deaminase